MRGMRLTVRRVVEAVAQQALAFAAANLEDSASEISAA
jgi:hypothetical protein